MFLIFALLACVPSRALAQCLGPDLVPTDVALDFHQPLPPGGWTRVTASVGNQGAQPTRGPAPVAVYLTSTGTINASDRAIAVLQVGALAPGAIATARGVAYLPSALGPGDYYVWFVIDPGNAVPQCDTSNDLRGSGNASFQIRAPAADDHPNFAAGIRETDDVLSATVASLDGAIESNQDVDVFRIDVPDGAAFEVSVGLRTLSDSVLEVLGPDGTTVLAENDDDPQGGFGSRITGVAPASPLFARVRHFEPTGTGSYRIEFHQLPPDDHPDAPAGVTAPRDVLTAAAPEKEAALDRAGDVDWFQAQLQAGARYRLSVELNGAPDAQLGVLTSGGGLLGASRDAGPASASNVDFTAPGDGVVYASVRAATTAAVGGYRLRLILLPSLADADDHPATPAETRFPEDALSENLSRSSGALDTAQDVDLFRLLLQAGTTYRVNVGLLGFSSAEATVLATDGVTVLAASSTPVFPPGGAPTIGLTFTGPASRVAYLRLRSPLGHLGFYSVELLRVDDHPDTPSRVTERDAVAVIGVPVPGSIEPADDVDVFALRLAPGRAYRIVAQPLEGNALRATLLDTDGVAELGAAGSPSPGQAAVLDGAAVQRQGVYFLRVAAAPGARGGHYFVRLLLPEPELRLDSSGDSSALTATLTVRNLPGPLSGALSLLILDPSALMPRPPFEGQVNGIKHAIAHPAPPLLVLAAAPAAPGAAGQATTATLGVFEFQSNLGRTGHAGRLAAVLTLLFCDTDAFVLFAPVTDAGLPRLVEAFDSSGALRPIVPDLAPFQERLGRLVRLDGRLSSDPNLVPSTLAYQWTVLKSPAPVTLLEPGSATPAFEPPAPGQYEFGLVAGNGRLTGLREVVSVIVNRMGRTPTAVPRAALAGRLSDSTPATASVTVAFGAGDVGLDASLSSSPVTTLAAGLVFRWRQLEGPPVTFRATTTGEAGAETDLAAHGAAAGSLRVTLPTTVTLLATVIDPEVASGVHGLRYSYRQLSGPRVSLTTTVDEGKELTSRTSFSPDHAGVHEFECLVQEVRQGRATDVAVRRRIRAIVDSATQSVPTARAAVRITGKAGFSAAASRVTTVTLPA
ncbi:MAG: pre-peptidase C-terminal domain-containing protein, partial [Candidatus Wallbacteria bacterium]|nr:pre-peptidase C-terminal domain-containing protein [Candidatus Wallbacteria bacterium]